MNSKSLFAFVVAAAALGSTGGVQASTMPGAYMVKVSYADLNLATSSGEQQLNRRLETAAHKACRRVNQEISAQASCQTKALALAAPRADAVVYAAHYAGKSAQG